MAFSWPARGGLCSRASCAWRCMCISVILVALCLNASGGQITTVHGRITRFSGGTVTGAVIKIFAWRSEEGRFILHESTIYSDVQGEFQCAIAPGNYHIFVSANGFVPRAEVIEIKKGQSMRMSFALKRDPHSITIE